MSSSKGGWEHQEESRGKEKKAMEIAINRLETCTKAGSNPYSRQWYKKGLKNAKRPIRRNNLTVNQNNENIEAAFKPEEPANTVRTHAKNK